MTKVNLTLRNLINYIAIFVVFSGGLVFRDILPFADLRISYLIIAFVLLLCMPFLKGVYFNKTFLFLFGTIIVFSLYNVYIGKDTSVLLTKQIIGIFSTSLIFYLLIKINKYNINKLFRIYLNLAVLVGLIGLFQELSYLIGFEKGYDFGYIFPAWTLYLSKTGLLKINSIMPEPSVFCYVMMPAFFVSVSSFSKKNFKFLEKWKSLVIISSVFLSFSLVGYIGIVFSLTLLICNYGKIRHLVIGTAFILILIFFAYNKISDLKMRVDDSINVITKKTSLEATNLSTFALFSNGLVAYKSFKDNPVFGSGLGSHEISYHKYIGKIVDVDKVIMFLNVQDANSLFLRLLSETGLFGILCFFWFIFKFHVLKKNDRSGYLWLISNAILAMFVIRLLRSGHYFNGGFFFFFWLYYFAGRSNALAKAESRKGIKINENTSYSS